MTFYDGTTILGMGAIVGTHATLTTVMLPAGTRSLRAYYVGDGTYTSSSSPSVPETVVAGTSLGLHPPIDLPSPWATAAIAVGDFNADGKLDLVSSDTITSSVIVFLGNGNGTFQTGVNYTVPSLVHSIAVGDFDGDGSMDIVTANTDAGNVSVLLGNGDGSFRAAVNYLAGPAPYAVAVADFNGDGKADLVVANNSGIMAYVLLGNDDGTFGTAIGYPGGSNQLSVTVADFYHRGKADIALGTASGINLLYGNGNGTFPSPSTFPPNINTSIAGVAVGDLNGDGNIDLVDVSAFGLYVFPGTFPITFGSPTNYGAGGPSYSVIMADMDGDGKLDVVVADRYHTAMSVFHGNGDGTLAPAAIYRTTPNSTEIVAVGDFNGDGKADVIAAGVSTGFRVYLGGAVARLTAAVGHAGGFAQGQSGATYSVTVSNQAGSDPTSGTVTVTETVPSGMTLVSMAGTGWTCPGTAANNCTRNDVLNGGASYSPITVTVNVAANAGTPLSNVVSVTGGGSDPANSIDPTTVIVSAPINITTNPAGLSMVVDGTAYTSPQSFTWTQGSSHTVNVTSPQGTGTRYVFANWSDSGGQAHTIVTPGVSTTYTANFNTQYLLSTSVAPGASGTISANPASGDGYYNAGISVQLTPTPAAGYAFSVFSGDLTGGINPQSVLMSAPRSVTANFVSTAGRLSRAVFRDAVGSIRMTAYPSGTLSNSGGLFASDPSSAEDLGGNLFVTARDNYNSIWANIYNVTTSSWLGWHFAGGIVQGVPALDRKSVV